MGAVEDYFSFYGAQQWQQLRTVFDHSDFKRTGYADLFTDADKYVDFLEDVPETIIFDLNDKGLIRRMSLYAKQPGGPAPAAG